VTLTTQKYLKLFVRYLVVKLACVNAALDNNFTWNPVVFHCRFMPRLHFNGFYDQE